MICPACTHENRSGAKFCEECAAPLARACASCGFQLRPAARFCDECGAPAGAAPPAPRPADPAGARKVVSIVFADLVGSTALHERLDPESARRFMESYYDAMRGAVESHGGTVTQLLGDGVKAVFGIPRVAEDDAIRAVRAAAAMQDAFRALAEQQRGAVGKTGLRVAVNTGEVVANDAAEIIGDPVNVAARLQEQGQDGDVVVGESTHRLVSTLVTLELLGSFALKGRSEAVRAYRVVSLERPAGAATAPFVGRAEELARLAAVYDTAIQKPAAGLAVLIGSPGLGKSRLIDEFVRRHADAAIVVQAHCDAAGGATFAPLAEALRELLGIEAGADAASLRTTIESALPDDADRARIAGGIAALVAGSPASPEETFFVVRRLLAGLAQQEPVVLVIDDLQWAEPLLIDLVEHLIQWGGDVPLLVLIGARPELREQRSALVTPGGLVSDVVTLSGLDAGAAMRLAANAIGAVDLPAAVAAKVLATSEGNPLFVGELVRMLVQEGAITKEGERWIVGANLAALEMPPTIHALLAARIERLGPEERTVLERAAVVGRHFSRSTVAALLAGRAGELDAHLEALRRSELIERDTGWLLGEPVLRFHHVLIRDAAYRRLLKGTRAELHAQLADWIEAQVGDAPEHDETIGRHLEQAHQLLRELGPLDAQAQRLGARAATRLAAAGRRALAGDDLPLAASLLGRALERLGRDDPARAELALDWCEALLAAGDVGPAAGAIDELARFAAGSDRLQAWQACFAGQHRVLTAPSALHETATAVAAAAQSLAALGDEAGEAKGHFVHALALSRLGQVGACEATLDRALAAARRAGDRRRANTVLAIAPLAALWGPSPVTRASGRCLDVVRVLRITQGAPAVEAVALSCQGVLEALRGRTDAARRMIASARKLVEELGITQRLLEVEVFGGLVQLLEGDAPAAERSLRAAYGGLRDLGLGIDAARAAALLARALLAQDRVEEAEALSHESEALAGDDLKAAIAWRGVRAEALARRGEHAAAVELASRAVELAAATDALLDHADARLALAAALRAADRDGEADSEARRARALWEEKGATLLSECVRDESGRSEPFASVEARTPAADAAAARSTAWRRAVRSNFAVEETRRVEAAVAARDVRALELIYRRDVEIVDHPHGVSYGHEAIVERMRSTIEDSTEPALVHEPLATFGDALALCRLRSTASGSTAYGIPTGATEVPYVIVVEADEQGRARRIDIFAEEKLDDAIAVLYERHAELLPDGPERARAAATAASFAGVLGANADPERLAPVLAPEIEGVDHRHLANWSLRGAEAYLAHLRSLHEVAADVSFGREEILALAPNAMLSRVLHRGTDRAGGGPYERAFLSLFAAGPDGRIAHAEWFDDDREAEALARFEELAEGFVPPAPTRRRVRPNVASAATARFGAALAARDFDAVHALIPEAYHEIDHSTGSQWGRDGAIASLERLFRSRGPQYELETLATVGEGLALNRRRTRSSGDARGRYDVGPYEHVALQLAETGAHGPIDRQETFAANRLAQALARLYERHAELSPEGPAREQAAATARTIAALLGPPDLDAWHACIAAGVEFDDHRILGFGALRGREAVFPLLETLFSSSESLASRIDDVLALEPHAFLARWTESGVAVGGGDFERVTLALWLFDGDGLMARVEYFDVDREEDAIARFETLTRTVAPAAVPRRVRPNVATEGFDRMRRAIAARDADAMAGLFDETLTVVHHPTHASYGRRERLATWRSALRATRIEFRQEILASLGEHLGLDRHVFTVEGLAEAHLAGFGASDFDELSLLEVDERGHWIRLEVFAPDHLGEAIARLYQCHAEQLPEGAERRRAAGIARSLAGFDGPMDLGRLEAAYHPKASTRDHRVLATWAAQDAAETLRHFSLQLELAPDFAGRYDDLLALAPQACVVQMTFFGTAHDSGGVFENPICILLTFDAEGLVSDAEVFEPEQAADALARFDALTGGAAGSPSPRPFENAAARADRRLFERFHARDWAGIEALAAPDLVFDERRRMLHNRCGRDVWLEQFRVLFDVPASRFTTQLVATRGERLSLNLHCFTGEVSGGGGPLAMDDHFALHEVDGGGRIVAIVLFDVEDEAAAYAELDARWRVGEGAEQASALAFLETFDAALARRDWEAVVAAYAPAFVGVDHRLVGWGTLRGAAFVEAFRTLVALAPDVRLRWEHLRASRRGLLAQAIWLGTRDGGAFENPFLMVGEFGADGRILRADFYDVHHVGRAKKRFQEIEAAAPLPVSPASAFANAASRAADEIRAHCVAADWDAYAQSFPAHFRLSDRRRNVQLELGRDEMIAFSRSLAEHATTAVIDTETLATRGERLALQRWRIEIAGNEAGPSEISHLDLMELDERGLLRAVVRWDDDAIEAAWAELDARFEAGEGAAHSYVLDTQGAPNAAIQSRDWDALAARCAPGFRMRDHRLLGWGTMVNDAATFARVIRSAVELAPDARYRDDHLRICARGTLLGSALCGTREGGAFENPFLRVTEVDAQGRILSHDLYDTSDFERALARFEEVRAGDSGAPHATRAEPNAATAVMDRWAAAYDVGFETGDWGPLRAVCAPGHVFDDRRRLALLSGDHELMIASARERAATGARPQRTLLFGAGDRVAVETILWTGGPSGGRFEIEYIGLIEIDAAGLVSAIVLFEADDARAAQREAWARWAAIEPERAAVAAPMGELVDAFNSHDRARWRAQLADEIVVEDHRHAGMGRLEGADAWADSLVALWELAPDTTVEAGWHWYALDGRGGVTRVRRAGVLPGGGAFESEYLNLYTVSGSRITHVELFEVEDLAAALTRFEALGGRGDAD